MNYETIAIEDFTNIADWDSFVLSHPRGSIFHTTAMVRAENSTKLHRPYAMGATTPDGNLCAILVAVRVSTIQIIASAMASRSIMYAEPIYLDNEFGRAGVRKLIAIHDQEMRRNTLFCEVRPNFSSPGLTNPLSDCQYRRLGYINYELAIDQPENVLFRGLSDKRRNNIRSAVRKGVAVEEVDLCKGLNEFYDLLATTYRRSRIPLADASLFRSVAVELRQPYVRLLIAYYDGVPVSAGCFLAFKDRVTCWYAGTKRIPGVQSMTLVFWEAIRRYAKEGYSVFDFAGAGWEGENYGPGRFKSKFGGERTNHGRYRKIYAPWKMKAANAAYHVLRRWTLYPS